MNHDRQLGSGQFATEADLHRSIATIKAEVDALQIAQAKAQSPWYQSAPVIVSIMALLFSFGTTVFSYYDNEQQRRDETSRELRELLIKISSLPLRNYELQQKYEQDALAVGSIAGMLSQENQLLINQAASLADSIPDLVTSTELVGLAGALINAGAHADALPILARAGGIATNFNDAVGAQRLLAATNYQLGRVEQGREGYRQAKLMIEEPRFSDVTAISIEFTNGHTEMYWAQMEGMVGNCDAFATHIKEAFRHADKIDGTRTSPLHTQIAETENIGCPPKYQSNR